MEAEEGLGLIWFTPGCIRMVQYFACSLVGFTIMVADPCKFYKNGTSGRVFLLFHVDDALVDGTSQLVQEAKAVSEFKISDLGEARYFLGINCINRDPTFTLGILP
jgi:hypothetical protein